MSKARILANLMSDSQITASEITGLELNAIQQGDTSVQVTDTGSGGIITVSIDGSNSFEINGGSIVVPSGATAARPGTPQNGMFRYNTEENAFEGYVDNAWGAVGGAVELLDCGTASSQTGTLYDLGSASSA